MKLISYILVLMLSTCWLLSIQEGKLCSDNNVSCDSISESNPNTSGKAETISSVSHKHESEACHFGHCGHIFSGLKNVPLKQSVAPNPIVATPYLAPSTIETSYISYRPPAFS